jgi:nucleotide-binding universal stress UspA family protein
VAGCHVRPHRQVGASDLIGFVPEEVYVALEEAPDARLNADAARGLFTRVAQQHDFSLAKRPRLGTSALALWHEMVGTPARILSIVGPLADLAVVSRPKAKSSGAARSFLLATLLNSARPVLVLPQRRIARLGQSIVIAWNQSADAAAAVVAGLPMLQHAEQVTVVSCGPENRAGPKSVHLCDYLKHWGINAERVSTRGQSVEGELEQAYRDAGGSLLLMGAYSRPRLRELVFGGVTETMLFKTNIPVLMLHR